MSYKLRNREVFRATVNGKEYVFTCYTQDTSYGFRHVCTKGFNNTTECRYIKSDIISKACYYNRTWERFKYETVLRNGIANLNETKEVKEELHAILIDKKSREEHEECEKQVKEFETLWNGLNETNKQHIRNGLGDNLITSEEQASTIVSTMKLMTAMQALGV